MKKFARNSIYKVYFIIRWKKHSVVNYLMPGQSIMINDITYITISFIELACAFF